MKILSIDKVRDGDSYTVKNEPIESVDLMERAATACAEWIGNLIEKGECGIENGELRIENGELRILKKSGQVVNKDLNIKIFCGLGNNGGDGLAIGRLLHNKFKVQSSKFQIKIDVYILRHSEKSSDDFKINYERLKDIPGINAYDINEGEKLPEIDEEDIVIDAIFGSGLTKPVKGFIADVINHINRHKTQDTRHKEKIISIDVPTGLFCDESTLPQTPPQLGRGNGVGSAIIEADYTLTLEMPKLAFMFAENEKYVGQWEVLPIGISEEYIAEAETKNFYTLADNIKNIYKPRKKFAHKGIYGHGLLISGSYGKMGAALLGSGACLRTGIGLLTTHIPKCGYNIIQTAIPEAMVSIDASKEHFTDIIDISKYDAIAVGPGIGTEKETANALKTLIEKVSSFKFHPDKIGTGVSSSDAGRLNTEHETRMLFDADAINILGENKTWLGSIPKGSVLTPHPKEFERIAGKAANDFERNKLQREFSIKYGVYVVLKGAYTSISTPEGECYFNSTGNPGMATAGSGDVLTGIILSLLAQSYSPFEACIMGVYLHGLAGDIAAEALGYEAMIAGDIIINLGNAFKTIK